MENPQIQGGPVQTQTQAIPYDQLHDLYNKVVSQNPGLANYSLSDVSKQINSDSNSHEADAGVNDNIFKQLNYHINHGLNATGLPQAAGQAGGAFADAVGLDRAAGEQAGQGLVRTAATLLPATAATFLAPEVALPAWASLALPAADSALQTYANTDSLTRAAIAAGSTVLGGHLVAPAASEAVGKMLADKFSSVASGAGGDVLSSTLPRFVESGLEKTAANTAFAATQEAGNALGALLTGQSLPDYNSKAYWTGQIIGQVPFAASDLATHAISGRPDQNGVTPTQSFADANRNENNRQVINNLTQQEQDRQDQLAQKQQLVQDIKTRYLTTSLKDPIGIMDTNAGQSTLPFETNEVVGTPRLYSGVEEPTSPAPWRSPARQMELDLNDTAFGQPIHLPDVDGFPAQPDHSIFQDINSATGKSAQDSAQIIEQQQAKDEQLRQSPQGAELLRQQLGEQSGQVRQEGTGAKPGEPVAAGVPDRSAQQVSGDEVRGLQSNGLPDLSGGYSSGPGQRPNVEDAVTGRPFTADVFHGSKDKTKSDLEPYNNTGVIWASTNKDDASSYAKGGSLTQGTISLKNPLVVPASRPDLSIDILAYQSSVIEQAASEGHDGVVFKTNTFDDPSIKGNWIVKIKPPQETYKAPIKLTPEFQEKAVQLTTQPVDTISKAQDLVVTNNKVTQQVDLVPQIKDHLQQELGFSDSDLSTISDQWMKDRADELASKGATEQQIVQKVADMSQQEFAKNINKLAKSNVNPVTRENLRAHQTEIKRDQSMADTAAAMAKLNPEEIQQFQKVLDNISRSTTLSSSAKAEQGVYKALPSYVASRKNAEAAGDEGYSKRMFSYLMKAANNAHLEGLHIATRKALPGELNKKGEQAKTVKVYAQEMSLDKERGEGGTNLHEVIEDQHLGYSDDDKAQQAKEQIDDRLDKAAKKLVGDSPTQVATSKDVLHSGLNDIVNKIKAIHPDDLKEIAIKAGMPPNMRNPDIFLENVSKFVEAKVLGVSDEEQASIYKQNDGKPVSPESVRSMNTKMARFLKAMLEHENEVKEMGKADVANFQDHKDYSKFNDEISKAFDSSKSPWEKLDAIKELINEDPGFKNHLFADPATDLGAATTWRDYLQKWAANNGYNAKAQEALSDAGLRMLSTYKGLENVRFGQLTDSAAYGIFTKALSMKPGDPSAKFVFMTLNKMVKGPQEFHNAMVLYTGAHEMFHAKEALIHESNDEYAKVTLAGAYDAANRLSKEDKSFLLQQLTDVIVPFKLRVNAEVSNALKEVVGYGTTSNEEFLATYTGLAALGQMGGSSKSEFADYIRGSDKALADFQAMHFFNVNQMHDAFVGYLKTSVGVTRNKLPIGATAKLGEGFATGTSSKTFGAADIQRMVDSVVASKAFADSVFKAKEEIDQAQAELNNLIKNSPDNWMSELAKNEVQGMYDLSTNKFINTGTGDEKNLMVVGAMMQRAKKDMGLDGVQTSDTLFGKKPGAWALMYANQFAEKFPVVGPVFDLAFNNGKIADEHATQILAPFAARGAGGDKAVLGAMRNVRDSALASDALNKIFLHQNLEGQGQQIDSANLSRLTRTLSAGLKQDVGTILAATSKAMVETANRRIKGTQASMSNAMGLLLIKNEPQLGWKGANQAADAFTSGYLSSLSTDPQTQRQGQMLSESVARMVKSETLMMLQDSMGKMLPGFQKVVSSLSDKPGYTPENRLGNYGISYVKDGERQFEKFKTEQDAVDRFNALKKQGVEALKATDSKDASAAHNDLNPSVIEGFQNFRDAAFDAVKKYAPEAYDDFSNYFLAASKSNLDDAMIGKLRKNMENRKFVGGRESVDVLQGVFNYVQASTSGLAKTYTREQALIRSNDPTMLAEPRLRKAALDHLDSVLNPDTSSVKGLGEAVFQYYIGANFSSLVTDRFHPLMALAPFLTENGAGMFGSYKYIAQASKDVGIIGLKGIAQATTIEQFRDKVADPHLANALFKAKQQGLFDHGVIDNFNLHDDVNLLNLSSLATDKGEFFGVGKMLKNVGYQYLRATRGVFQLANSHNNLLAYVASYRAAMDGKVKGVQASEEEAHEFATRAIHATLPQGGAAGRPLAIDKIGAAKPVAGVMLALMSYTGSMVSMMARLAHDSLPGSGLRGADLSDARKALGQAIATHVVLAGALGLPFAGAVIAGIEKLFPQMQIEANLRESLAKLAGGDQAMGSKISGAVMKGIPSVMTGVDLSGRLGLGSILGANSYNGFEVSDLLGPAGNLMQNILTGIGDVNKGQVSRGVENMLPTAFKNLSTSYLSGNLGKDQDGNLLVAPTETERFLNAIGFKPNRISEFRDQQRLQEQAATASEVELSKFHKSLADMYQSGDVQGVQAALMERQATDPTYEARAGLNKVIDLVQARETPPNLLNQADLHTADEAAKIQSTFPSRDLPTETDKLLQRQQLASQVPIAGAGQITGAEIQRASSIDNMVQQYGMTKAQASALLDRQNPNRGALMEALMPQQ